MMSATTVAWQRTEAEVSLSAATAPNSLCKAKKSSAPYWAYFGPESLPRYLNAPININAFQ